MPVLLIVEDDDLTRDLLCEILSLHAQWQVTAVANGHALLTTLDTLKPDLILLDVAMYGMSGTEAYRLLREHATAANVPVLFMTVDTELIKHADLPGVYTAIEKPFHLDELLQAVDTILATP
jgi:DNA-binding response OmpR family regulator